MGANESSDLEDGRIHDLGGHCSSGRYGEESPRVPRLNEIGSSDNKVRQGRIGNMVVPNLRVQPEVPTDCQQASVFTSVKPFDSDSMEIASSLNTSSGSGGGRDFGGYAQAFHNATIASLRKACTDRRISSTGVREVLVARLVEHLNRQLP